MNSLTRRLIKTTLSSLTAAPKSSKNFCTGITSETRRQNDLFNAEQKRQRESIGRIEKIEIQYKPNDDETTTLLMNKDLSTPFDCAKHLGRVLVDRSAVAMLNDTTLWHMHKPLTDSCNVQFLHYNIQQPSAVNKIFWRSCSFLFGAVISRAFKDNIKCLLHSFPSPNVRSGSFIYDVQLSLDNWVPTQGELKVLSIEFIKLCQQNHPIECLDVSTELAQDLFRKNTHKFNQIPDIAAHSSNSGTVTLFRAGDHIDISRGPMVPNTNHLGRVTVANVIKLDTDIVGGPIYRFQGVALPREIVLNHFAYHLLEERAQEFNPARIPGSQDTVPEDNGFVAAQVTV